MDEHAVRNAALGSLDGGQAFMRFEDAVADFPPAHYNTKPSNVPYSFWHLLEHIRICNRDILDYVQNPEYRELAWPDECWPACNATADQAAWNATMAAIRDDIATLRGLVADPEGDLTRLALHANGNQKHTLLREILVVTDHTAYHLGEFAILRQMLGLWPASHT